MSLYFATLQSKNAKSDTLQCCGVTLFTFVQIKNNLSAFGHSKAFELTEEGFRWIGDYEITADEILGGIAPKACKLDMAKRFLQELADSKNLVMSNEILELAAQEGISKRTLETAKKELGIKAKRINGSWYWELHISE